MCMPFLGKLFSGGQRRRNNATATPRPSLAPTPQQSNATIRTTHTANNMAVIQKNSVSPVNVGYGGLVSDMTESVQNGSIASDTVPVPASAATPTTSLAATDSQRQTSWLEYLGIHRSKKSSAGSPPDST